MTAHAGTDVTAMTARAVAVRELFARREADAHGRAWTTEEIMLGFVGDVGDLAKIVQGKEGVRPRADLDAALAHELADCLWSVLVLADAYDVDLPAAFDATMDDLTARLSSTGLDPTGAGRSGAATP
ncbi:nucleotide pyrophosphohydrolase [Cellulomonas iranensis]|uniref:nucleotide pyrophosphohydrolase n=1 Tax=Cellulomonas iranensis TaxID=76862 RepID=UPI003D7CB7FD